MRLIWLVALVGAGLGAGSVVLGLLRRRLVAVRIYGISMQPRYRSGDRVLVRRRVAPVAGLVVVVEAPGTGWDQPPLPPGARASDLTGRLWLIKRVAAAPGDPVPRDRVPALSTVPEQRVPPGKLVLLGDNPEASFDSRRVGYFPVERVLGAVHRRLPP